MHIYVGKQTPSSRLSRIISTTVSPSMEKSEVYSHMLMAQVILSATVGSLMHALSSHLHIKWMAFMICKVHDELFGVCRINGVRGEWEPHQ